MKNGISILVASRKKDNPNFGLPNFLDSLKERTRDLSSIEVLIKFDDDDEGLTEIINTFASYPFKILHFFTPRGRGYLDLHVYYNYLYLKSDRNKNLVSAMADDFIILEDAWEQIVYKENEGAGGLAILHQWLPNLEKPFEVIMDDYYRVDEAPIWSRQLIDLCGGLGPTGSTDMWTIAIEWMLKNKFNLSITRFLNRKNQGRIIIDRKLCDIDLPGSKRFETDRKEIRSLLTNPNFIALTESIAKQINLRCKGLKRLKLFFYKIFLLTPYEFAHPYGIKLVQENYFSYNIISCGRIFYAIAQEEGEFDLLKFNKHRYTFRAFKSRWLAVIKFTILIYSPFIILRKLHTIIKKDFSFIDIDRAIFKLVNNTDERLCDTQQKNQMTQDIMEVVNASIPKSNAAYGLDQFKALSLTGITTLENLKLSPEKVCTIVNYFKKIPVFSGHVPAGASDQVRRYLHDEAKAYRFGSYSVEDTLRCPFLLEIALSPEIIALVEQYLGCAPTIYSMNTWWSFPGFSVGSTQDFHRDVDDFKFLALFIYLTDVKGGQLGGQHQFIEQTHDEAQVTNLLHDSQVQASELFLPKQQEFGYGHGELYQKLFSDKIKDITGEAGSLFLADTYALHKGVPPVESDRLVCWVRYGLRRNNRTYINDATKPMPFSFLKNRILWDSKTRYLLRVLVTDQKGLPTPTYQVLLNNTLQTVQLPNFNWTNARWDRDLKGISKLLSRVSICKNKVMQYFFPIPQNALVKEGFFSYNIIFCENKYYGLSQADGAFDLYKMQVRAYHRPVFTSTSLLWLKFSIISSIPLFLLKKLYPSKTLAS